MTGETITTAAELDALPVGSVVVEGDHTTPDEEGPFGITTIPGVFHRFPDGWYVVAGYGARAPEEMLPVTVLFRPDAPQPATTDDTVERAARAVYERIEQHWPNAFDGCDSSDTECEDGEDCALDVARAALAAAGAGTEVDREALVKAGTDLATEHLGYADMSVRVLVERITDAALAARGDAATPTEVEWGVRYPAFGALSEEVVSTDGYGKPHTEASARAVVAREGDMGTVVHRTASEWREAR